MIKSLIKILVENELKAATPTFQVWFDMDGVLADFDGKVKSNPGVMQLQNQLNDALATHPELKSLHQDELKKALAGEQSDPELKIIKKLFNKLRAKSFMVASNEGHFLNLDVLNGAEMMLRTAYKLTGRLPNILTAPMESHKNCEEEKRLWIEKHFSGLYDRFICTQEKQEYANSKFDILIDDRPKYTTKFSAAGGTVILHTNPLKSMKELKEIIDTYS